MESRAELVAAVLTGSTCGQACWEAREDICRCSCGGKNHGTLKHGGDRPERTCKIHGRFYRLGAIGSWLDIRTSAYDYNVPLGPDGDRDFNRMLAPHLRAIDKPASQSQSKWEEVVNCGIPRPSLMWIPI